MAHEVGYARVSKREQNPEAQEAELHAAGCERVFVDHGESSRVIDSGESVPGPRLRPEQQKPRVVRRKHEKAAGRQ
ncbi:recombinase family protein [Microbacterium sp. W4I20]|uniref:recombinase family protein n=1 Tax=Microbacterium sp. W4I20 TaxID=3042262 RepID=UPI00277EAD4B|nr:recombinase family protein [Microbacterium sp. W4I20]MDQ0728779.1 DNA invertase Pin-like site-specific DNA recombinase [Microbacterium sp. W4I20]